MAGIRLTLDSRGNQLFTKYPLPWVYVPHPSGVTEAKTVVCDANGVEIVRDNLPFVRYWFMEPYSYVMPRWVIGWPEACPGIPPVFRHHPLPWTPRFIPRTVFGQQQYVSLDDADDICIDIWDMRNKYELCVYTVIKALAELAYSCYRRETGSRNM